MTGITWIVEPYRFQILRLDPIYAFLRLDPCIRPGQHCILYACYAMLPGGLLSTDHDGL